MDDNQHKTGLIPFPVFTNLYNLPENNTNNGNLYQEQELKIYQIQIYSSIAKSGDKNNIAMYRTATATKTMLGNN